VVAESCTLERLLSSAKGLVFDFDGTLVDSNPIKAQAFGSVFKEFGEQRDEILAYCNSNHHTPRDVKFRMVYEKILKLPFTSEVNQTLHRRFEGETTEQIIEAREIPGASDFLRWVQPTHWTGLLSSTPHPVMLEILERRNWFGYFRTIQGAPINKSLWLKELQEKEGWRPEEMIFFGDTQEDASAAQAAGCVFVAVAPSSIGSGPAGQEALTINDFRTTVSQQHEVK